MSVAKTIAEVRDRVSAVRAAGKTVGFIPTMGALHAGHASLIDRARSETGFVTASIFVNPLQFGPGEDFQRYPRTLEADLELCRRHGVDLVFVPEVNEVYAANPLTTVDVARISENLCGAFRPGHFRGVATVVLKLLNIVKPDRAYFGEKDAQQLAVIKRMTLDLNVDVAIVGVPTVREPDGLALSSRNRYLDPEERRAAPVLYRALEFARRRVVEGSRNADEIKAEALSMLQSEPLVRVEYLEIVGIDDMQPVAAITRPVRIVAAVRIGATRLIDNLLC